MMVPVLSLTLSMSFGMRGNFGAWGSILGKCGRMRRLLNLLRYLLMLCLIGRIVGFVLFGL